MPRLVASEPCIFGLMAFLRVMNLFYHSLSATAPPGSARAPRRERQPGDRRAGQEGRRLAPLPGALRVAGERPRRDVQPAAGEGQGRRHRMPDRRRVAPPPGEAGEVAAGLVEVL